MTTVSRLLILLTAISLSAPLRAASAHPRLLKSTPAADSRSVESPRQVTLTFNESLDLALARVTLLRGDQPMRTDSLRLASADDKTVIVPVAAALSPGRYTVKWQVTGDDGHPVRGEFTFDVLAAGTREPRSTHGR